MALNLATIKDLPSQISSFLKNLKIKNVDSSEDASAKVGPLSSDNWHLFLQVTAFMLFAMLSFWVINQVRVNGPIFNTLKEYQELTADTSPPPMYPLSAFAAYNEAYVASTNSNIADRDAALANAAMNEVLFKKRSAYWRKNLDNKKLQASLEAVIHAG